MSHLIRLVDDLMDVCCITRGKVTSRTETVEVGLVLTRVVEMVNLLMEQRTPVLSVDLPAAGMVWHGDPVRLAQIVGNLLTNAARYTPPGGEIHLSARGQAQAVVVAVQDNGQGLSAEVVPRIFDLFYRGERSIVRAQSGLGVGLALVKSLVAAHGGSVHAHSEGLGLAALSRRGHRLPYIRLGRGQHRPF